MCDLRRVAIRGVNENLKKCMRLKSLHLDFSSSRPFAEFPVLSRMVYLSTLTLTRVRIASPESCAAFAHLSTLHTLTLRNCIIPCTRDWSSLGAALQCTPLKSLRLMSVVCDAEKLICLLESLILDHLIMNCPAPNRRGWDADPDCFEQFLRHFTKSRTNPRSFLLADPPNGRNLNGVLCGSSVLDLQ